MAGRNVERMLVIFEMIKNNPGIPMADLVRETGLSREQIGNALPSMEYAGLCVGQCEPREGSSAGTKSGYYVPVWARGRGEAFAAEVEVEVEVQRTRERAAHQVG